MIIFFFYIFDEDANTTVPVEIDNEYNEELEFFFDDKIRKIWHKQEQEWYFSILDVILYLTESSDPKQYLKKMKHRDPEPVSYTHLAEKCFSLWFRSDQIPGRMI